MAPPPKIQRDIVMTVLTTGAVLETAWIVYIASVLPRHYVANHWDLAWAGLDSAQVFFLLLTAWAAWRGRAVLVLYANTCATLLLVDAWFDVTTARYNDLTGSLLSLAIELPSAVALLWIGRRTARRLTKSWLAETDMAILPSHRIPIPRALSREGTKAKK